MTNAWSYTDVRTILFHKRDTFITRSPDRYSYLPQILRRINSQHGQQEGGFSLGTCICVWFKRTMETCVTSYIGVNPCCNSLFKTDCEIVFALEGLDVTIVVWPGVHNLNINTFPRLPTNMQSRHLKTLLTFNSHQTVLFQLFKCIWSPEQPCSSQQMVRCVRHGAASSLFSEYINPSK